MKLFSIITSFLFAYFSFVQYNDPDKIWWMAIYAAPCLTAVLYLFHFRSKFIPLIGMLVLAYALFLTSPGFIDWISNGAQQGIWGAMTEDQNYIEEVREFIGVMIAVVFQAVFVISSFKK